jgi:hypothetical protein
MAEAPSSGHAYRRAGHVRTADHGSRRRRDGRCGARYRIRPRQSRRWFGDFGLQPEANQDHGFSDQDLEPTHRAVPTDMLEPASGCEHTPDLAEGSGHIVDRAQHKSDVYRVKTIVRERNRLADPIDKVDRNAVASGQRYRLTASGSPRLRLGDDSPQMPRPGALGSVEAKAVSSPRESPTAR